MDVGSNSFGGSLLKNDARNFRMGACHATGQHLDPDSTDMQRMSADELMSRGIAFAQQASVERSVERRLKFLNYSRDFLRAALLRLPPNDRTDFAAAHIASVLVTLGDDPQSIKRYVSSIMRRERAGSEDKRGSGIIDESAIRVMESLAFASPAIDYRRPLSMTTARSSPLLANLSSQASISLDSAPPAMDADAIESHAATLLEKWQSAKVSVRIFNSISGEEDIRFELPLRSYGTSIDSFYSMLSRYVVYFSSFDLKRLEYLRTMPGGGVKRRPEFDRTAFIEWLSNPGDQLRPLLFCPSPITPPSTLDVYEPLFRLLKLTPSKMYMRPLEPSLQAESSDEVVVLTVETNKLPEGRVFSVSLTDQRDSGRTLQFPGEVHADRMSVISRIPVDLLRPRNEEDARVFDVFVVVESRWRSDNRKILSVLTDEDSSDDAPLT